MAKKVVTFHFTLNDSNNKVFDTTVKSDPLSVLEGSHQTVPGLEKELFKLQKGDKKTFHLKAHEAFGHRDEALITKIPRTKLPTVQVSVGDLLEVETEDEGIQLVTVKEITASHFILDGNHPLAGQNVSFDVEIVDIRTATPQEVSHGHAHGAGGHSH